MMLRWRAARRITFTVIVALVPLQLIDDTLLTVAVERLKCRKSFSLTRNGPTAHVKRREYDPSVTPIRSGSD